MYKIYTMLEFMIVYKNCYEICCTIWYGTVNTLLAKQYNKIKKNLYLAYPLSWGIITKMLNLQYLNLRKYVSLSSLLI